MPKIENIDEKPIDVMEQPLPGANDESTPKVKSPEGETAAEETTSPETDTNPLEQPLKDDGRAKVGNLPTPSFSGQHPLQGVPDADELPGAEEILAMHLKEAEPLVGVLHEYLVQCLFSKTYTLRDAAIQKVLLDLKNGTLSEVDDRAALNTVAGVVKRVTADKIAQVFLNSQQLLQQFTRQYLSADATTTLKKNEVQSALDPLLALLVERLGDSNKRVHEAASESFHGLAASPLVGGNYLGQHLLKLPKKKATPAKALTGRLQVLQDMINEVKAIQPNRKDGLATENVMNCIMKWFTNPSGDVRAQCVALAGTLYLSVGMKNLESHLSSLRPVQREAFEVEFERVSNGAYQRKATATPKPGVASSTVPPTTAATKPAEKPAAKTAAAKGKKDEAKDEKKGKPKDAEKETKDKEKEDTPEFVCQFCEKSDKSFDTQGLDLHYWRECLMLMQCEHCQQIIEITALADHRLEECEQTDFAYEKCAKCFEPVLNSPEEQTKHKKLKCKPPKGGQWRCPLCHNDVPLGDNGHQHYVVKRCPGNPRT
eukprot:Platyproteum_vivax@DN5132_c0_g1_i2.p1